MRYALFICGPTAVGKSSHIPEMLKHAGLPSDFSLIDPDKSTKETQKERSDSAFEEITEHIEDKKSFVYVGSCLRRGVVLRKIEELREADYRIIACLVYISLEDAIERASKRTEQPVPEDVVVSFYNQFKKLAPEFMKNKMIDEIYLYNNETEFSLLLSKKKKRITCRKSDSDFFFDISKYC
jgi:predicted ABC-type ATPase